MQIKSRRSVSIILAVAMALGLFIAMPITASKASGGYNVGDIAVINGIIENNGLNWPTTPDDGAVTADWMGENWPGVGWSEGTEIRRIVTVTISYQRLSGVLVISSLTSLEALYCRDNNLCALELTNLSSLTYMECNNNSLTSLDLSGLSSLRFLHCQNNNMTNASKVTGIEDTLLPDIDTTGQPSAFIFSPQNAPLSNFAVTGNYVSGHFPDVDENEWYGFTREGVISLAFEYGLMKGNNDGTFAPIDSVTIAEAITIAARVHSIYASGDDSFEQGEIWYQVYVDYAVANGIISASDFDDYDAAATRAEMAYIFSRSLPESEFTERNAVTSLPDVSSFTPYSDAIFLLYKAGIVAGDADTFAFRPDDSISRAEAAAIISRVILPSSRFRGKVYSGDTFEVTLHRYDYPNPASDENFYVEYIQITGLSDTDKQEQMNSLFSEHIAKFEQEVTWISEEAPNSRLRMYLVDVEYAVVGDSIISARNRLSYYRQGAAYPWQRLDIITIDVMTGLIVRQADVITVTDDIQEILTEDFVRPVRLVALDDDQMRELFYDKLYDSINLGYSWGGSFYLTENSIGFILHVNHALGDFWTFEISYDDIYDWLTPEFQGLIS